MYFTFYKFPFRRQVSAASVTRTGVHLV